MKMERDLFSLSDTVNELKNESETQFTFIFAELSPIQK